LSYFVCFGKAARVSVLAAVMGIGAAGSAFAANCSNAVPNWFTAFNADTYHDCDGARNDVAACNHLDYVNNYCCVGASGSGETTTCVNTVCDGSILRDATGALLTKAGDCVTQ